MSNRCERCGHEDDRPADYVNMLPWHFPITCIANLRADLAEAREMLVEVEEHERDDDARLRAIREGSTTMMRQALGREMFDRLWGPELERLGRAFDTVRADLEAERARSWEGWDRAIESEQDYEQLRPKSLAAEERAARAEAQCAAMREAAAQAAETQPFYPDTHTGMRQQWVKLQIAARIRALDPPDAGRDLLTAVWRLVHEAEDVRAWLVLFADLDVRGSDSAAGFAQRLRDALTAVRRLCEAARALLYSGTTEAAVKSTRDLAAALGDPALAELQGTHEKVPGQDAHRERD